MTIIYITADRAGDHNIKLQSNQPEMFKACLELLKAMVPRQLRRYDPEAKQWHIAAMGAQLLHRWLDCAGQSLGAQIQWVGEGAAGEQGSDGSPVRPTAPAEDPYATLHLLPTAPVEVVRAAFRALAGLHHPDRGGDGEQMRRVNAAYEALARRLKAA